MNINAIIKHSLNMLNIKLQNNVFSSSAEFLQTSNFPELKTSENQGVFLRQTCPTCAIRDEKVKVTGHKVANEDVI